VGPQLGGQAYSQVIFFEDKRAFDEFASGHYEFGAQASAVAITAGASAQATTGGAGVGASGTRNHATTASHYRDGMAVFTIAKGGLMHEASIGGQRFSYRPK
jgi:lipid-binding SYLF domain-containing protein